MLTKENSIIHDSLVAVAATKSDAYVIISNANDEIIWVNESLEERTGYALNDIVGFRLRDVFRGEETNSETSSKLDIARESKQEYSCEILTYTKHKEEFWLQLSTNPISFEGQSYFVTIATEITELKKTQKELVKANQRVKALVEQKNEVLSALTHDLKAPLTSIDGLLDLFKEVHLAADEKKYLDLIRLSSQTMKNLVENILELGQRNSQINTVNIEPCSIEGLFRDVIDQFKVMAEMSGNVISFDFDPSLKGNYYTDNLKLSRVLSNLIGNGIKFTENGKVRVRCSNVSDECTLQDYHDVMIEIEDTGAGISKEAQEKIFNRYEQEDDEIITKFGGTGLGLSICKKIVQELEGNIRLQSEEGIGTTFFIRLPLQKEPN